MDIGFSEEQATAEAVTPEFWTRRSLTYYAAWAVDGKEADAPLAVSMAKSYASDASPKGSNAGIQLHGGIGMTWEHDLHLHLYMKRAKASEVAFGDATWHRGADERSVIRLRAVGGGKRFALPPYGWIDLAPSG